MNRPLFRLGLAALFAALIGASTAAAQSINLDLGSQGGLTNTIVQMIVLVTVLTLAP
jgi:flagellar biosynthetic protein FliP